jgi:indolepyruvate ferredoxin oxidoreductase beta subunit
MVLYGAAEYPDVAELIERLKEMSETVKVIESTELAKEAGEAMASNVVMVGALAGSGWMPIPVERFTDALEEVVPAKVLDVNRQAFESGVAGIKG